MDNGRCGYNIYIVLLYLSPELTLLGTPCILEGVGSGVKSKAPEGQGTDLTTVKCEDLMRM